MKMFFTHIIVIALFSMASVSGEAQIEHRWEALGLCNFTDDLISGVMSDVEPYTYLVEVEHDALNEGYYRIADPYGELNPHDFSSYYIGEGYGIVINAQNPQNVIVEYSEPGFKIDGETLYLYSLTWLELKGEFPTEAINNNGLRGTLKDNCIHFKGKGALWASYPSFEAQELGFSLNQSGLFCLDLTPQAGISSPVIDDSEPVYYNLQGMKIKEPQAGELVICKRGAKVQKILVR